MAILEHLKVYRRLGALCLGWLAFLSASRLLLMVLFDERVVAAGGVTFITLQGLRFDGLLIGGLLGLVFLVKPWLHLMGRFGQGALGVLGALVGAMSGFVFFVEASTASFIRQFDSRPNYLFVEYLRYPREVFATLVGTHPVQFVVFSLLATGIAWFTGRWLARDPRNRQSLPWAFCVLATPVVLVLMTAMIRGTLDHRPLNPSNAAFSQDAMVNQLALNSPYSVMYAVYERRRDLTGEAVDYGAEPGLDVLGIVREAAGLAEPSPEAGIPTLHAQAATRSWPRPRNLVIVLEESLGADYVGALGGKDLTPNLDALADQGIWFERLYATGIRSARGIEAIVSGFTPSPLSAVLKHPSTQTGFFTLAQLLRRHGYQTRFIYGGESHFDNMRRFLLNNGFEEVIDENDFDHPVYHGAWGVSDEDVLQRAHESLLTAGAQPTFTLVFTTSHHEPFDIPPGRVEASEYGPRETSIRYADWALGQFLARARESDYWDDTLWLVVADHNARVFGGTLVPVERFRVPGVILGAGIEPRRVSGITSQIDLLPTLLSLLGLDTVHPAIGRDLTRPEHAAGPGRAMMQFHANHAYMEDDWVVVLQPGMAPLGFRVDAAGAWIPLDDLPGDLRDRALAHAAFGPSMIRDRAYRLPDAP